MSELPHDSSERSRKNESIVLQRLLSVGQANVARELKISESTLSRRKDGDIAEFCTMLAVLGLKVVPTSMKCYRPEDIEPLLALARQRMQTLRSADQLAFEDDVPPEGMRFRIAEPEPD